jgi:hypothetical protein
MRRSGPSERRHFVRAGRSGIILGIAFAGALLLSIGGVAVSRSLDRYQNDAVHSGAIGAIARRAIVASQQQPGWLKATATPAPTATKPAPAATATTPAAAVPAQAAASGSCTDPAFVTSQPLAGWTDGSYYLYNDMWNISGYTVSQTMYACSYSNWYVVADMNNDSGNGAVKTYPNAHMDIPGSPAISSLSSVDSTFAENSPNVGIYEDAYDIWINGEASSGSTEIMIWTQNHGQAPGGSEVGSVTLDGRGYTVWHGGSYIAFVADTNFTSGTMNLLDFFNWVIGQGWMPSSSTLSQVDYGAELVSTDSTPQTFTFTNFSVTTS